MSLSTQNLRPTIARSGTMTGRGAGPASRLGTDSWHQLLAVSGSTFAERQAGRDRCNSVLARTAALGDRKALQCNGFNVKTRQHTLRLQLTRGLPALTRKVAQVLQVILPQLGAARSLYEPITWALTQRIGVNESSGGTRGTWYLAISEAEGIYELRCLVRTRVTVLHQATDRGELLDYVENEAFFEDLAPKAPAITVV